MADTTPKHKLPDGGRAWVNNDLYESRFVTHVDNHDIYRDLLPVPHGCFWWVVTEVSVGRNNKHVCARVMRSSRRNLGLDSSDVVSLHDGKTFEHRIPDSVRSVVRLLHKIEGLHNE